jgi:hypothetical protein
MIAEAAKLFKSGGTPEGWKDISQGSVAKRRNPW